MKTREGFKSGLGFRTIGQERRKLFGDDVFGILPDIPPKPIVKCSADTSCHNTFDPNTQTWSGSCLGTCMYG